MTDDLTDRDSSRLIAEYAAYAAYIEKAQERMERIEIVLRDRMVADDATTIADEVYDCKLRYPAARFDISKLAALREVVPGDELARAFTPAHEETRVHQVPDQWDMRVARTFRQFGREAQDILDGARMVGTPRVRITRKVAK